MNAERLVDNIKDAVETATKAVVSDGPNDLYAAGQILAYTNVMNMILEACIIEQTQSADEE